MFVYFLSEMIYQLYSFQFIKTYFVDWTCKPRAVSANLHVADNVLFLQTYRGLLLFDAILHEACCRSFST